ncbi:hypothetical protein EMPG_10173 [Blastomyces silverae]|uniref:Uncharacterized protein n=1 Tax=Blastomyces silverae TaxID=2060906 RepID=A0A0H1B5Z5_9EURO|nr:hypothetical protein EMPG_10173 [Blastomyces silverae]
MVISRIVDPLNRWREAGNVPQLPTQVQSGNPKGMRKSLCNYSAEYCEQTRQSKEEDLLRLRSLQGWVVGHRLLWQFEINSVMHILTWSCNAEIPPKSSPVFGLQEHPEAGPEGCSRISKATNAFW